ncbi:MAG: helix-turn-helix transcriptional regulator [Pirellulaceae bacterium]
MLKQSPQMAALVLGIDNELRQGILQAFHQAHAGHYLTDKKDFLDASLTNECSSDIDLAARLGVSKSAISNWRKDANIRADKLDLLVSLVEHHTDWPTSRNRYDRAFIAACEFCRNCDADLKETMSREQLECVRMVLASTVWSNSVIQRSRDYAAIKEEAERICSELREKGLQSEVHSLESIDAIIYKWLVPYLRCVYVIRGEAGVRDESAGHHLT